MKGGAHLSSFTALSNPRFETGTHLLLVDRDSFPVVGWRIRGFELTTFRRFLLFFLRHNRVALTTNTMAPLCFIDFVGVQAYILQS